MDKPAAFAADYADIKLIKTRKVCQIILEIPVENAAAFINAFGVPNASTTIPVAIARIEADAVKEKPKDGYNFGFR